MPGWTSIDKLTKAIGATDSKGKSSLTLFPFSQPVGANAAVTAIIMCTACAVVVVLVSQ